VPVETSAFTLIGSFMCMLLYAIDISLMGISFVSAAGLRAVQIWHPYCILTVA